jgi:hypothetical protein
MSALYGWLNQLRDAVNELRPVQAPGILLSATRIGVARQSVGGEEGAPTPGTVNQFKVQEVLDDTLRCRTWLGTALGTTDITIAKPYKLRRTPFDAQTVVIDADSILYTYQSGTRRTATVVGTTSTEKQVIVPRYLVGDIIYACEVEDTINVTGTVTQIDLNVDGRAWARKEDQNT